jgi:23S rRNA pseudouridine1911/1915/1917 synthase
MTPRLPVPCPVPPESAGQRLDRFLTDFLPDMSRARVQALIAEGCVTRGEDIILDAARKTKAGECYRVTFPALRPAEPEAEDIPLTILFEDAHLLVIDKQAGLVVHPAPGNPDHTLVNALLSHCEGSLSGIGGVKRPGIVHRLDKDTSGLMIVAKDDITHRALTTMFSPDQPGGKQVHRTYLAFAYGTPMPSAGRIDAPIGRNPHDRKKMAVTTKGGKASVTLYKTLQNFGGVASLIECTLLTGRTHQIRVHLSHLGHPLIGDGTYGGRQKRSKASEQLRTFPRQALHAAGLAFQHPITGKDLTFSSALPADLQDLKTALSAI